MYKFLFFSLFLAVVASHGMEKEINSQKHATDNSCILFDKDYLSHFTQLLCASYNYKSCDIRVPIRALSNTNKFLHDYYAQEKTKQEIIDSCVIANASDCRSVARDLGCYIVFDKIKRFTNIVWNKEKFIEEDKHEIWYLNMLTKNKLSSSKISSLLLVAIGRSNIEAAHFIMDHVQKLHIDYRPHRNPLCCIADMRYNLCDSKHPVVVRQLSQLLAIAQRLLKEKGILVDGRVDDWQRTPLITAVVCKDREYVRLLLEYGADPYKTYCKMMYPFKRIQNSFHIEEEKGWLQKIIDEVALEKEAIKKFELT